MSIAIIKYNAGNIRSVLYALERIGVEGNVTDDEEQIRKSVKVIFPGVGEAASAMAYLKERNLDKVIRDLKQPVLGICLGMQLMCTHTEENDTTCLGIVPVPVKKFTTPGLPMLPNGNHSLKVPQIGWNNLYELKSPLFNGVAEDSYIYNVHSYYAADSQYTIAKCSYGVEYAAAVSRGNFYGVQFHTEKSSLVGERILKNFLSL